MPGGQIVHLLGERLTQNAWLIGVLESNGYRAEPHRVVADAPMLLAADRSSMALVAAGSGQRRDALEMVYALDAHTRRRVLVLTWRTSLHGVRRIVEAGAPDFQRLPTTEAELLLRLELRARDAHLSLFEPPTPPRGATAEFNRPGGSVSSRRPRARLSDREHLLYEMLSSRLGSVVGRGEILARIWGLGAGEAAASNIVDVYIRYLRVKLAKAAPWLTIRTVRGVGYVLEPRSR